MTTGDGAAAGKVMRKAVRSTSQCQHLDHREGRFSVHALLLAGEPCRTGSVTASQAKPGGSASRA